MERTIAGITTTWHNWAGNQQCAPAAIDHPASEGEIALIVREAARNGQRVKAIGAGHSFTGIALTEGRLLALDRFQRIISDDSVASTVTVDAGITLAKLNEVVWARGLAMQNLGDIAYQSIAGATSTATHGTGGALPPGIAADDRYAHRHRRRLHHRVLTRTRSPRSSTCAARRPRRTRHRLAGDAAGRTRVQPAGKSKRPRASTSCSPTSRTTSTGTITSSSSGCPTPAGH